MSIHFLIHKSYIELVCGKQMKNSNSQIQIQTQHNQISENQNFLFSQRQFSLNYKSKHS